MVGRESGREDKRKKKTRRGGPSLGKCQRAGALGSRSCR